MVNTKKSISIYTQFLFRLFRVEDELGINAHSDLPKLGSFYGSDGEYDDEAVDCYTDANVEAVIVRRSEVITKALADKPELLTRIKEIMVGIA